MLTFEYIAPAVQRLMDLCTNGLFLNLRNFPEPLEKQLPALKGRSSDRPVCGSLPCPGGYGRSLPALSCPFSLCDCLSYGGACRG